MGSHTHIEMMKVIVAAALLVALSCAAPVDKAASSSEKLKTFFPFVSEIVAYTGAVIPTALSKKHKHSHDFEMLVQTSAKSHEDGLSAFDRAPDAAHTLEEMNGMGEKVQMLVGYNPVEFMTDLLGKEGTVEMIEN